MHFAQQKNMKDILCGKSIAFYPFPTVGTAEILINERAMGEQGQLAGFIMGHLKFGNHLYLWG